MEYYTKTLQELETKLATLESNGPPAYIELELGIKSCNQVLLAIRERVEKNDFHDLKQECAFFKTVKPPIMGYVFHFLNMIEIEKYRPRATQKEERKYFVNQISILQSYFIQNREFYEYHLRGLCDKDLLFFTRKNTNVPFHFDSLQAFVDYKFATSYDQILAKILGNQRTIEYLQRQIHSSTGSEPTTNKKSETPLKWTGSKVDLVELTYALQVSGVVNNGQAGLNELAQSFEKLFAIELGDIYRIFREIRDRKNIPTKLLDNLKTSLLNKMVEADG